MRVTYDAEVDAAYIYFKDIAAGEVATTVPCVDEAGHAVNLDYDHQGQLVGIEVLDARLVLPPQVLDAGT